jgi:hypothetical protein
MTLEACFLFNSWNKCTKESAVKDIHCINRSGSKYNDTDPILVNSSNLSHITHYTTRFSVNIDCMSIFRREEVCYTENFPGSSNQGVKGAGYGQWFEPFMHVS